MLISLKGKLTLTGTYEVELVMSEKQFGRMSKKYQKEYIQNEINWTDYMKNADVSEVEIEELYEYEGDY